MKNKNSKHEYEIGMVGLGVMGRNLLLNMADHGFSVAGYDKEESEDIGAEEAVALFCYQAKKWIGAFAASLGGLDTLVFAGDIGENCPVIRSRICKGLEFLGIEIEEKQNKANAPVISTDTGQVAVRVIDTDEELMIVKTVSQKINLKIKI